MSSPIYACKVEKISPHAHAAFVREIAARLPVALSYFLLCFEIQNFSLPPFTTSSKDGASVALIPISRQLQSKLYFQVQVKNSAKANKSHVPCQFP